MSAGQVDDGVDVTPERQRLYLHVGLPKSGSTYLQAVLGGNRAALKSEGFVYPYVRQEGMFYAAVEMAGDPANWGMDPASISGTFEHLLRRGRRVGGSVVISHEIFGGATAERIAAIGELVADFDLHLVLSARDLGRTLTAEWQERVKNGRHRSFERFAESILARLDDAGADETPFWPSQNLVAILSRWQVLVPPDRIHLVVCPAGGAPPDQLWRRFAAALGLPADAVDLSEVPVRNESLGTAQIAFLRRVLEDLDGRLEQPWFSRVAKRWFAQSLLSRLPGTKPVAPAPVVQRLLPVAQSWIEFVRAGGYVVHGDLEDLLPVVSDGGVAHPDDATDSEMLSGLPSVVAEMLLRTADLRQQVEDLRAENAALASTRDELDGRLSELETSRTPRRRRWWRS